MTVEGKSVEALVVKRTIAVNATVEHAFTTFTERHGRWWPMQTHHIGAKPAETVIIEPRVGGRWFERDAAGAECDWGRVLVWQPPHRLVLAWQIGADWKYDPALQTEVELRFVAIGGRTTRIEFEHRGLEAYGERGPAMRDTFGSEGGWNSILQRYAGVAEATA